MNNNGIDTSTVINIINKLKMYIENENNNITKIKKTLSNLENNYIGYNEKKLKSKTMEISRNLDIMLNNKKSYTNYLEKILNSYINFDTTISKNYSKEDIN